jgi:hypothetical protein
MEVAVSSETLRISTAVQGVTSKRLIYYYYYYYVTLSKDSVKLIGEVAGGFNCHTMKAYGEVELKLHVLLTLTLE